VSSSVASCAATLTGSPSGLRRSWSAQRHARARAGDMRAACRPALFCQQARAHASPASSHGARLPSKPAARGGRGTLPRARLREQLVQDGRRQRAARGRHALAHPLVVVVVLGPALLVVRHAALGLRRQPALQARRARRLAGVQAGATKQRRPLHAMNRLARQQAEFLHLACVYYRAGPLTHTLCHNMMGPSGRAWCLIGRPQGCRSTPVMCTCLRCPSMCSTRVASVGIARPKRAPARKKPAAGRRAGAGCAAAGAPGRPRTPRSWAPAPRRAASPARPSGCPARRARGWRLRALAVLRARARAQTCRAAQASAGPSLR